MVSTHLDSINRLAPSGATGSAWTVRSSRFWSQIDSSSSHLCISRLALLCGPRFISACAKSSTSGSINANPFSQVNTLRLYLTCIRNTLEAAMCLKVLSARLPPTLEAVMYLPFLVTLLLLLLSIHQKHNLGDLRFSFAARIFLARSWEATTNQRWISSNKSCCKQEFSVILFCELWCTTFVWPMLQRVVSALVFSVWNYCQCHVALATLLLYSVHIVKYARFFLSLAHFWALVHFTLRILSC